MAWQGNNGSAVAVAVGVVVGVTVAVMVGVVLGVGVKARPGLVMTGGSKLVNGDWLKTTAVIINQLHVANSKTYVFVLMAQTLPIVKVVDNR